MSDEPQHDWPDLAGRLENRRHTLPIRVYFEDTDFSGVVYHATYLRWCERGRSDLLRLLGIHHAALHAGIEGSEPAAFVVRRLEVDYLRPARIDELLTVLTECIHLGRAQIELGQQVLRDGELLCRVVAKVVLVGMTGKPVRLPPIIGERFRET